MGYFQVVKAGGEFPCPDLKQKDCFPDEEYQLPSLVQRVRQAQRG
jgi:hypothetical protein